MGISFFNSYLNEWGVGRSILDYDEKLYSQDLLKWEIICWGKKNNFSYFDLTVANPTPDNDKEIGFITSGAMSPRLGYGIALAYVDLPYAKDLNSFNVKIRNNTFTMDKAKLPFYKDGTYLK